MFVVPIVEGDGEVAAFPVLLRRVGQWLTPEIGASILAPIRVRKDRFLNRQEEFRRHLLLAAAKAGKGGWILILLDADDDCPALKGVEISERAKEIVPHRRIAVVLANREYEAWFIAAAASINGHRGLALTAGDQDVAAENPRDAKGWLAQRLPTGTYRESTDQAAFSAVLDLQLAFDRSRSFRKLCSEWKTNTVVST
jgi:hypothetical protein